MFKETELVTARDREAAFLAGQDDALAIYRMKATPPSDGYVPLVRLQKSGRSPLDGNYDLIHTAKIMPEVDHCKVLDTYEKALALKPGDIVALKQAGTVTCWYVDQLAYSKMPGLLDNFFAEER